MFCVHCTAPCIIIINTTCRRITFYVQARYCRKLKFATLDLFVYSDKEYNLDEMVNVLSQNILWVKFNFQAHKPPDCAINIIMILWHMTYWLWAYTEEWQILNIHYYYMFKNILMSHRNKSYSRAKAQSLRFAMDWW